MSTNESVLILHNIRSSHNVGSIFRTADTIGISKIYLIGYTPKPHDRFGRANKEIAKTALGAEKTIPWQAFKSFTSLFKKLKKEGFTIVAIEQDSSSVDYKKVKAQKRTAFVLGSEVGGLPKSVLHHADVIAEIPMRGGKESLNVSVAAGVALFQILDD